MQRLALAVVVCPLLFVACGGDSPSQPSPPPQPSGPTKIIGLTGSLNFGDVVLGEFATASLTIRNTGTSDLKISAVTLPPAFATNWQVWREGTIAPNASATVDIYFQPDAPKSYSGNVVVSADHTSGSNTLPVSGTGVFTGGLTDNRIQDPEIVQNILEHNQDSRNGGKRAGFISRWELPVPVHLAAGIDQNYAIEALEYLEEYAGISYVLVSANADPRVTVRTGTDGLGGSAGARGGIEAVYSNNRSRRGIVVIGPNYAPCQASEGCMNVYRHELIHALGIYGHLTYDPRPPYIGPGSYPFKEMAVLKSLYALPHGAKLNGDGTWQVGLR
jgi:hypothetical protein